MGRRRMPTIRVEIPEEDWAALETFVRSQPAVPFGIDTAVRSATCVDEMRIIAFRSPDAVTALIEMINGYARTWELPGAVPLNRVLPRLYRAISAGL
jgi:hypothetical protein